MAHRVAPDHLKVYANEETYLFEPVYNEMVASPAKLQVSRPDGIVQLNKPVATALPSRPSFISYGVIGMIQLLTGKYLIVVTERKQIGTLLGHAIWKVEKTRVLPCNVNRTGLTASQRRDEDRYLGLLREFLSKAALHYSNTFDLSSSLQSQFNAKRSISGEPFLVDWKACDQEFLANRSHLDLLAAETDPTSLPLMGDFVVACIQGFVEVRSIYTNSKKIILALVSRRSPGRVGARYHSRGIDKDGNVTNFVETEQIVVVDERIACFNQLRGSIPLFWKQPVNLKYCPVAETYNEKETEGVFQAHFRKLLKKYGSVVAVNLVDQDGQEGRLANAYAKQVRQLADPNLRYVFFDFHHNCRNMNWKNISVLVDSVEEDLERQSFFMADLSTPQKSPIHSQSGVPRTNCMDCLDRTNVVESVFAQRSLTLQLRELGVLQPKETVADNASLAHHFNNMWADNADAISVQYSGTGALKTDYTRTGACTRQGAINDGINSVVRYCLNNFYDGSRQDSMDLFFGAYKVHPASSPASQRSPFHQDDGPEQAVLIALLASALLCLWFIALGSDFIISRKSWVILTSVVMAAATRYIKTHGRRFVQLPRLIPPSDVSPLARTSADREKAGEMDYSNYGNKGRTSNIRSSVATGKVHAI